MVSKTDFKEQFTAKLQENRKEKDPRAFATYQMSRHTPSDQNKPSEEIIGRWIVEI